MSDQRRFGVFVELDGYPDAIAFVDIGFESGGAWLPDVGTRVTAEVREHVVDNCRVKLQIVSPTAPPRPTPEQAATLRTESDTCFSVTLVVDAPDGLPGYEAQFEPEGGIVAMSPGDRVTVTMTGPTPPELLVYPYDGGVSIWRCMNVYEVTVTDKTGDPIEGLY